MSAFADASALVKLYADEPHADQVRSADLRVISALSRVEVPAALWRKHRIQELSAANVTVLVNAFETDYAGTEATVARFAAVAVSDERLEEAARLTGVHGLRAYGAVQLACAMAGRRADSSVHTFACFDERLSAAAATEGFSLL